jgi:hypothetical protein
MSLHVHGVIKIFSPKMRKEGSMKRGFYIALIFLLAYACPVLSVFAAFDLPSYVFRIDQLGEAQNKAKSNNAPIVFLYSDENTDCELATAASLDVIQEFKDSCVIIYVTSGKDKNAWTKIPKIVRTAIRSPEAGRFIPKSIIVNPGITKVISVIPYTRDSKKRKESLRRVNDMILID